jgi:transcriptional regulator with XRE-family HTH domain
MPNIEPFYIEVGQRIQDLRSQRGLTQEDLGRSLVPRVTRASIANIETGKQRMLAHTLVQLADVLDVKLGELLPPQQESSNSAMRNVEEELEQKLSLPKKDVKKLAAKLKAAGK